MILLYSVMYWDVYAGIRHKPSFIFSIIAYKLKKNEVIRRDTVNITFILSQIFILALNC